MDFLKRFGVWIGLVALCGTLWLWWWLQPERQVRRAEKRLVTALEKRDFDAFQRLLADDYSDQWGHNKTNVVSLATEVFQQFLFLTIQREEMSVDSRDGNWVVSEKMKLQGTGGPLAAHIQAEAAKLTKPFQITWRNDGGPTRWVVVFVTQPELEMP